VVHQGQRLPLRLEASNDLFGVHAGLDELQRHQALDRFDLLGHPHRAHAAFADRLNQLVRADDMARLLGAVAHVARRRAFVARLMGCGGGLAVGV
jgi:hypothetical protein